MGDTLTVTLWIIVWSLGQGQTIQLTGRSFLDYDQCAAEAARVAMHRSGSSATCVPQATHQVPIPPEYVKKPVD